ncbi:MAG: 30S ribosomal protein S16 [Dehalococcoidia bacterium]|nr:30S ribosomal protein S16 [Dehalococcoidia bacterium]
MLRMRLHRVGKNKQPSYRIVVIDGRKPRDSQYLEQVGFYNPRQDPPLVTFEEEKAVSWLQKGAKPSLAVEQMLKRLGVLEKVKKPA